VLCALIFYKYSNMMYFILIAILGLARGDAVCDKNTFINELKQDLADNNMLDCLRVIVPPHMGEENSE
jgi:hypothetical protein